ncbi:MAG: hypothetical protein HC880_07265 [Bacteroidia bacterium]|nr:hypothetical protein [Bacteroidia bacterium]
MSWQSIATQKAIEIAIKQGWFEKIIGWLGLNNKKILIMGASGTGKTQFVNSFNPKTSHVPVDKRTLATSRTRMYVASIPIMYIDTAGQSHRDQIRREAFTKGYPCMKAATSLMLRKYTLNSGSIPMCWILC